MNISKEFLASCINPVFVETGTLTGDGVAKAIDAKFPRVISIELSPKYYNIAHTIFEGTDFPVELVLGDSGEILYDVIKDIDTPITFFLDGHYSNGDTARSHEISPLIKELRQIKQWLSKGKSAIILIDDMRCWSDTHAKDSYGFNTEDLIEILDDLGAVDINYVDGSFPNDILVANICTTAS